MQLTYNISMYTLLEIFGTETLEGWGGERAKLISNVVSFRCLLLFSFVFLDGTYIVNGHHGHLYSFIIENFMILKCVIDLTQLNFHVKIHATEKIK
jgi:hypothetical protein